MAPEEVFFVVEQLDAFLDLAGDGLSKLFDRIILVLPVCSRPEAVQVGPQLAARTELVADYRQHLLLRLLERTREVVEPLAVVR